MVRLCDELRIEHVRLEPQMRVVSDRKLEFALVAQEQLFGLLTDLSYLLACERDHLDGGDDQNVVKCVCLDLVFSRECSSVFFVWFSISSICCPPGLCKEFNPEIMSFLRDLNLRQLYFGRVKVHSSDSKLAHFHIRLKRVLFDWRCLICPICLSVYLSFHYMLCK